MKKLFTTACLVLACVLSMYAQDAKSDYKKIKIGLGLEGALPSGGLKTLYKGGAGLTLRVAYALDEKMAITGTTGAIAFIPKKLNGVDLKTQINIPIKAGFKYMLTEKVYGIAETGYTISKFYMADPSTGKLVSASASSFTYAPGIGVELGGFDASLRYEGYSGASFIGLRLGFNF